MGTANDADTSNRILAALRRTLPDGTRVHSDDEIAAFMPFLLLTFAPAIDARSLPAAARALLGSLAHKLGVDGADAGVAAARFRAHFEANPPSPTLVTDVQRFVREALKDKLPDGASAFAAFADAAAKGALSTTVDVRPAGTVRASPFARAQFHAHTTSSKKGS